VLSAGKLLWSLLNFGIAWVSDVSHESDVR